MRPSLRFYPLAFVTFQSSSSHPSHIILVTASMSFGVDVGFLYDFITPAQLMSTSIWRARRERQRVVAAPRVLIAQHGGNEPRSFAVSARSLPLRLG